MINVNKKQGRRLFVPVLAVLVLLAGCAQKRIVLKSPPHYDFSAPEEFKLDLKLREISGLAYDPKGNHFLAIQDESGKLFIVDKETKDIDSIYAFGGKGDYEDVAIMNGIPYILRSDGSLFKFMRDSLGQVSGELAGMIDNGGKNDFETLYYDPSRKALVVLCKNCSADEKKWVSAYAFYPDSTGFDPKPIFQIDREEATKLAPQKSSHLQPSAAAIHPVLQKLFILSSASNQLVVADLDGHVEFVYVLAKRLFPQPEGLCFKQNGDMYITNEGGTGKATMIKFTYRP